MNAARTMLAGILLAMGLVSCHSASKEEQVQSAQDALLKEAMSLQQCERTKGCSSQQCAAQRKAYEDHLADFKGSDGR